VKVKSRGRSVKRFTEGGTEGGGDRLILLEGSQALPTSRSDKGRMKMGASEWSQIRDTGPVFRLSVLMSKCIIFKNNLMACAAISRSVLPNSCILPYHNRYIFSYHTGSGAHPGSYKMGTESLSPR
jgi:hypothetical protein